MPIWFVYRCPYDGPMSKHVRRLDGADTLLEWFRSIWRPIPDRHAAYEYAEQILGTDVYSFGSHFFRIAEENLPIPETIDALHEQLESSLYVGEYRATDDTIQAGTEDDEWAMVMYWFTDDFARRHPQRVMYLLREDWRLPDTAGPGGFRPAPGIKRLLPATSSEKSLYLVDHDISRCGDIDDFCSAERLPGLRLPDLVPWLLTQTQEHLEEISGHQLVHIRRVVLQILEAGEGLEGSFRRSLVESPTDEATWAAYSDWLADQDRPPASLHLLELALRQLSIEPYENGIGPYPLRAQTNRHSASLVLPARDAMYDQWFFFDDLWASENVDLANALLDYTGRWNVLDDFDEDNESGPDISAGEEEGPG